MSFIWSSRPASRGVGSGAKRRLIENERARSKCGASLAFVGSSSQMLAPGDRTIMTSASAKNENWRIEKDALGEVRVPAEHLWGAQTERSRLNFVIGVERHRWGRPVIRAFGLLKKCAALANLELGQLPKEKVDLIVRGVSGRHRRQARRRVSAGRVSDRVRHAVQHERQRGDRQPGHSDRRRRDRVEEADPSERRRQPQPVVERRVPDRHAYRHGPADQGGAAAGGRSVARHAERQGEGLLQHHDGRPDAYAGRDAAHARAGDFGLGGAARPGDRRR